MADQPSQHFDNLVSSLQSLRPRPLLMTGIFKDILVKHFQPGNIEDQDLQHLVWKSAEDTAILIESASRWTPASSGKRPAIIIKRNAFATTRLGIGDKHQLQPTDPLGHEHFTVMQTGSHTLFCLSQKGAQAEILAAEVYRELLQFGPVIRDHLRLMRFQVMETGPLGTVAGIPDTLGVPITVGYIYSENWQLREQAPTLGRLSYRFLFGC